MARRNRWAYLLVDDGPEACEYASNAIRFDPDDPRDLARALAEARAARRPRGENPLPAPPLAPCCCD